MALCIRNKTKLKHHRNPSGFNNKVKWLLSESKRNLILFEEIKQRITRYPTRTKAGESWEAALFIASQMIKEDFKGSVREYLESIYVPEYRKNEKTWYRKIMFK